MNDDTTSPAPEKLVWSTPKLVRLGSMADVRADLAQPPNDGSNSPTVAAS